jgi:hypothetical protein
MYMIRHDNKTYNAMVLLFEIIKPLIHQIVTIGLLYQWQPFMAGKGDEEQTLVIWYIPADWHCIKLVTMVFLLQRSCSVVAQCRLPTHLPTHRQTWAGTFTGWAVETMGGKNITNWFTKKALFRACGICGGYRSRTGDLLHAMQTL